MTAISVSAIPIEGKKALLRCDFNVPLDNGQITDPTRIDASLDTIRYVLSHGGAAVLCSHLGRPKERTPDLSLKPVAEYLSKALEKKVALAPDCIGEFCGRMVNDLAFGEALLLENLRFHPEEEANDRDFSHELARGKNLYVNDAFGTAHRAHASTVGVTRFLHERAAGFLMLRELEALQAVTQNPGHPYVLILGGAKISDKIGVLKTMLTRVEVVLIGGAMAYTFMRARGIETGKSRVEEDKVDVARELFAIAAHRRVQFVLPADHVVASAAAPDVAVQMTETIPADKMGLDIGSRTIAEFIERLSTAKTIVWNGPLGFFEIPAFEQGTLKVGEAVANLTGVTSLIGGGDTAAAFSHQPWARNFTHISTGGGATLEYLEGIELPGVKALENAE
jgi:phosphoglycerate kinase